MTKHSKFEAELRDDLHTLEETTGAPEIFRLAKARNRALAQTEPTSGKLRWPVMGASMASVLLATVLIVQPDSTELSSQVDNQLGTQLATEMIIDDSIELYEDLDFYYWLAETDQNGTS